MFTSDERQPSAKLTDEGESEKMPRATVTQAVWLGAFRNGNLRPKESYESAKTADTVIIIGPSSSVQRRRLMIDPSKRGEAH